MFQSRTLSVVLLLLTLATGAFLPRPVAAQSSFVRGDSNGDNTLDLSDVLSTLGHLFLGSSRLDCFDAADVNDDGILELTDVIYELGYLFLGGPPPSSPFPACGADPSPRDALGCNRAARPGCESSGGGSPIVQWLESISLSGTEPCCLPGLGRFNVRSGLCESLGGSLAPDSGCPERLGVEPRLLWNQLPPPSLVDDVFHVSILPVGGLVPEHLTLDLFKVTPDGLVGPVRLQNLLSPVAVLGPEGGWVVNTHDLPKGQYTLRATAWRSGPSDGTVTVIKDGQESPTTQRTFEAPVATIFLPRSLEVKPTAADTLSMKELAALASHSPAGDPQLERLLQQVEFAEGNLRMVEASVTSPQIESLRNSLRQLATEANAAGAEAAQAQAEAEELKRQIKALEDEEDALVLVNRYLDSYFGPEDMAALKELIKRREDLLSGATQDDRPAIDDALQGKRDRLSGVETALEDKKAKLEDLKKRHAALKAAIREQYHKTRRTLGDNMGHLNITDSGVTYDITGLQVVNGGRDVIKYAPMGKAYNEEKKKLDALISEYEELWKAIQDCEKEIADLEKDKEWLKGNIEKLENAATEVDEIDSLLDKYFDVLDGGSPQAPHLDDLVRKLREVGAGWLADMLADLFGSVPRTCEELEKFKAKLEALRDAKHAREAVIADEIGRLEDALRDAERRAAEAEERRRALEEETRREEEALRKAQEEARAAAEEEYRRAKAAAEEEAKRRQAAQELAERIRQLRERAQGGDEDAIRQLVELIGLTLLDELVDDLPLGSIIGGFMTLANMPECACDILKAMLALFADGGHFRLVLANEVIRAWRECASLPAISSVEIGAEQLARAVDRLPRDQRRRVCEALERAIEASDCD